MLATRNQHKAPSSGESWRRPVSTSTWWEPRVSDLPGVAETGSTFAANALLARDVAQRTGLVAIADDSGLCVDALNGMPGILAPVGPDHMGTMRETWSSPCPTADVPSKRRGAAFHCAAVAATPDGEERVVEACSKEA